MNFISKRIEYESMESSYPSSRGYKIPLDIASVEEARASGYPGGRVWAREDAEAFNVKATLEEKIQRIMGMIWME